MAKDYAKMITKQNSKKEDKRWEGTMVEYLRIVKKDPVVADCAPRRIYDMINSKGTSDVSESQKIKRYEDLKRYDFFEGKIFNSYRAIHDIMKFLAAGKERSETGKRILLLNGPPASGKSTISALIKRGLENFNRPVYRIKDCEINEEPLHLIPNEDREEWEKELNLKIEGHLCPKCKQMIDEKYTDKNTGIVDWGSVKVERFTFSEIDRNGIGTFSPSDEKSQDISELIGQMDASKALIYEEGDARIYSFTGDLYAANRGFMEYIEMLKSDRKFHNILLNVAQEGLLKSSGFPLISIDEVILGHTNMTEFNSFIADKKFEALHDRIYSIEIPYVLEVDDEVKIYEKQIKESNIGKENKIHIAPYVLKICAMFAVITRLKPHPKISSLVDKMKLYNGEALDDIDTEEIDIKSIREEGRVDGEGMDGLSPRFVINSLFTVLSKNESKGCVNVLDIIKELTGNFNHHLGIKEEDVEIFKELLIGDGVSISTEYKKIAKNEVHKAFIEAHDEAAEELHNRYMMEIKAYTRKELVQDKFTGDSREPDENLMRSIESLIPIPEEGKREWRNSVFVFKLQCLEEGREWNYKENSFLEKAIEEKLMADSKNMVALSLGDSTNTDPKKKKKRQTALKTLIEEKGYCKHCAANLLSLVSNIYRQE